MATIDYLPKFMVATGPKHAKLLPLRHSVWPQIVCTGQLTVRKARWTTDALAELYLGTLSGVA
jgi:hypothetical protein